MKKTILLGFGASAFLTGSIFAQTPTILNNSFELPNIGTGNGSFKEGTPPTNWTECCGASGTSGGGIVGNGSAYGNSNAPDGTQALLLKSTGGVQQTLSGFSTGTSYVISFDAEGRTNFPGGGGAADPIEVLVDGTPITFGGSAIVTPTLDNVYHAYTSDPFTVAEATPVLALVGQSGSDQSSFVDLVTVAVPEPSTWIAAGGLLLLAAGDFRRQRRA